MVDMTRLDSAEYVREHSRSEASRPGRSTADVMHSIHDELHSPQSESSEINLEAVVTARVDEWRVNNPGSSPRNGSCSRRHPNGAR